MKVEKIDTKTETEFTIYKSILLSTKLSIYFFEDVHEPFKGRLKKLFTVYRWVTLRMKKQHQKIKKQHETKKVENKNLNLKEYWT